LVKSILEPVKANGFDIVSEMDGETITVRLTGSCDMQTTPLLDPFLSGLHDEATRMGARGVIIDCENLYFMNSASVKSLVTWISKLKSLGTRERYSVSFRTNSKLSWQKRNLEAIRRYAADIVSIDP
jgi:anti-anti-sigma factor